MQGAFGDRNLSRNRTENFLHKSCRETQELEARAGSLTGASRSGGRLKSGGEVPESGVWGSVVKGSI